MLNTELKQAIDAAFAGELTEPAQLYADALLVRLKNEAVIELRVAGDAEYAIAWRWSTVQLRLDTAPLHPHLATFPRHLHDSQGMVRADPVTRAGESAWDSVRRVIAAIAHDPLLLRPVGGD